MKYFFLMLISFSFVFCYSQNNSNKSANHIIATFNTGFSFRVGDNRGIGLYDEHQISIEKIKPGISYDLGLYVRKGSAGIGLKYNILKLQNTMFSQSIQNTYTGEIRSGNLTDDLTISFYGVSFIMDELNSNSRHEGNIELSLGYNSYNDKIFLEYVTEIKGGGFGMTGSIGYKYRVLKNFSIGPTVNFVGGVLREYEVKDKNGTQKFSTDKKNEMSSMWRIDLSFGLIYRL